MLKIFKNVEVGDKVWDFFDKNGIVEEIDEFDEYPIKVKFNNKEWSEYDYNGCQTNEHIQTLFWNEIIVPKSANIKNGLEKFTFTTCNDCKHKIDGYFQEECISCKRYYACHFEKKL